MANFYRGTSLEQDSRYYNKKKQLLSKLEFPDCFSTKVNIHKVNLSVMENWIDTKVNTILGFEDDIIVQLIVNLLNPMDKKNKNEITLDPKEIQLQITPFLAKDTKPFVEELWQLLISAQDNDTGIPTVLLEKKKKELREKQDKMNNSKAKLKQRMEKNELDDIVQSVLQEQQVDESLLPEQSKKRNTTSTESVQSKRSRR